MLKISRLTDYGLLVTSRHELVAHPRLPCRGFGPIVAGCAVLGAPLLLDVGQLRAEPGDLLGEHADRALVDGTRRDGLRA